jgi:hypothetical protein
MVADPAMTPPVIDYSYSYPGADAIAAAGYIGAMRYLGGDDRCIQGWERGELLDAGVGIGLIWELAADRVLDGWSAGRSDADSANWWADSLGAPEHTPIYYCTDFAASDAQIAGPILDYYAGAASVGGRLVRCYGGAPVIETVRAALGTGPGWQAAAASWSDYRLSPDASMLQEVDQVFGNTADHNTVLVPSEHIDFLWGHDMPLTDDDLAKISRIIDERLASYYTGQRALQVPGETAIYELVHAGGDLYRRHIPEPGEMALRRYGDHLAEADWTGDARQITDPDLIDAFRRIPVLPDADRS